MTVDRLPPPRPEIRAARELVGPGPDREDVTDVTLRALVVRVVDWQLHFEQNFGKVMRELAQHAERITKLEKSQRRSLHRLDEAEEEITVVTNLKKTLRQTRRWAIGLATAVLVLLIAGYVGMKLGIRIPG